MDDLLYQYNPWWEEPLDLSALKPRKRQLEQIHRLLSPGRVLLLTGLRRVGKTSLMRLLVARLVRDGTPAREILYVSLDDYLLRKQSIIEVVASYRRLHRISVDRSVHLLLDEVTYKEDFQQQLKNLIDRENATVVATSSSSSLLRDQRAFLTGRSTTLEIQPLDFPEYMEFKGIAPARRDQHLLDGYFRDYMREGGLPEHVLRPRREYVMDLVDDIIQKDIAAFHGVRDHQVLRDYFTLLMERAGKMTSINKIGRILSISPDTSRRYLRYFEDTFLVHLVQRWGKTNERILSPRKLYACDLAVKHVFVGDRDLGSYFENYVYLRLRPHQPVFYFYENGVELDFVTGDGTLIEAKYNSSLEGAQLRAFEDHPSPRKLVVDSVAGLSVIEELWQT